MVSSLMKCWLTLMIFFTVGSHNWWQGDCFQYWQTNSQYRLWNTFQTLRAIYFVLRVFYNLSSDTYPYYFLTSHCNILYYPTLQILAMADLWLLRFYFSGFRTNFHWKWKFSQNSLRIWKLKLWKEHYRFLTPLS